MKEIITIRVSRFLTDELVRQIAQGQWGSAAPSSVNRSRQYIFDELIHENDCFGVVAVASDHGAVGRLHCVKSKTRPTLWYYGDLFVLPAYRRLGIAKQMVSAAIEHLSETDAATLRCYVAPDNTPSRALQASLGFSEKPYEAFEDFTNDGEIMYEIDVPSGLTAIPATVHEAYFVRHLFIQNREALAVENISMGEWRTLLSAEDPKEKHFLICKGAVPIAYMRLVGLPDKSEARVTMLFAAKGFRYPSIASFALGFAEQYARGRGLASVIMENNGNNTLQISEDVI